MVKKLTCTGVLASKPELYSNEESELMLHIAGSLPELFVAAWEVAEDSAGEVILDECWYAKGMLTPACISQDFDVFMLVPSIVM